MNTTLKYAVIGAGPCGLAAIRCFQKQNIPVQGFELHSGVGGLWDINNPLSAVYQSAHLISSKRMTEYNEFPMADHIADYPHHSEIKNYFSSFAEHFKLKELIKFNTKVLNCVRDEKTTLWTITYETEGKQFTETYKGLVIANGIFNFPNIPKIKGQENFKGEIVHSSKYKDANMFNDKRVLIVGAGNTGCDIVVDAVHHAKYVDMSVRRGYYFVPKYLWGKPADTVSGKIPLPDFIKKYTNSLVLKASVQDPVAYGFPKPEYKMFESHPIVNSLILHHLGHGDIKIQKDIDHLEGNSVFFKDGTSREYDLIVCSTGYKLNYPFIDRKYLNWPADKDCPQLHLNIFHPEFDNLFVLGMIEATGIGWQGRYDQAELVMQFVKAMENKVLDKVSEFRSEKKENKTDLTGGMKYLDLPRMSFYVHKDTYMKKVKKEINGLKKSISGKA